MFKYRIVTQLNVYADLEYRIQERILFIFWTNVSPGYKDLEYTKLMMQEYIRQDKLRKSFKSEIIKGN